MGELGVNDGLLLTEYDIESGNAESNFLYFCNLMGKYPNLYLANEHVNQILTKMDALYIQMDDALIHGTASKQFSFSEAWLAQATKERELAVSLCLNANEIIFDQMGGCRNGLQMIKAMHNEFNILMRQMQSYCVKILSSARRGMKIMINDDGGLQEKKIFSTIDKNVFARFYKPKTLQKLSVSEQASHCGLVIDKCSSYLVDNVFVIKQIFDEYSGRGGDTNVLKDDELATFCKDIKVFSPPNQQRNVHKHEFATFLVEICYKSKGNQPLVNKFRIFLQSLWHSTKTSSEIKMILALPSIQTILKLQAVGLQQVFKLQAVNDSASNYLFITKKKWMELFVKMAMITPHFTHKMARQAFEVCNNDYGAQGDNAGQKMIYQEFVEALVSVALIKSNNIFVPLPQRVETFLKQLIAAAI